MEDQAIIRLFFARDQLALQELDKKYGGIFKKLAFGILNSLPDAQEALNDAYLGVWNAIPPANPQRLEAYACRVVRNSSLKIYRARRAFKRNSKYDAALDELEDYLPAGDSVEGEAESAELAALIQQFLASLSPENRVIFLRRYWFSDSYAEIALRTGLTEKAVSVRLTRLRQKLKQYLTEMEVFI